MELNLDHLIKAGFLQVGSSIFEISNIGSSRLLAREELEPEIQLLWDSIKPFSNYEKGLFESTGMAGDLMLYHPTLGLANGGKVGWFAPNQKSLDTAWNTTLKRLEGLISGVSHQKKAVDLSSGGRVDFWSLGERDGGRGRRYSFVVMDDLLSVSDIHYHWNYCIRPKLIDEKGISVCRIRERLF